MSENIVKTEIFHKEYNLDKKDNLEALPEKEAVFGVFAIIHEKPVHCRFISETDNLQKAVKELFEKAETQGEGFKKFMQGPWIQMLVYELLPDSKDEERKKKVEEWINEHNPKCDDDGEYPKS